MDNPFKSPAVLSICSGFLGLERGLEAVIGKIRVVAYVEVEAFGEINLVAGMESGLLDPAPIWTNAKTFDARPLHGRLHGITAGYPCPGESLAGLREGHLYKGFLWPALRRIVAAARPVWCYFENVDDHLTGTYPIVYRSLRNMGYAVEAGIYSASECGASIEAQRLFILAVDETYVTGFRRFNEERFQSEAQRTSSQLEKTDGKRTRGGTDGNNRGKRRPIQTAGPSEELGPTDMQQGDFNIGPVRAELDRASKKLGEAEFERRETARTKGTFKTGNAYYPSPQEFPLGQGPEQWEWEEPRTVESSMGYTIERYNFTEDLLRANGNMVPPQQSALAFRDLMRKHGIDFLIEQ